jgi:hypothetical protein
MIMLFEYWYQYLDDSDSNRLVIQNAKLAQW